MPITCVESKFELIQSQGWIFASHIFFRINSKVSTFSLSQLGVIQIVFSHWFFSPRLAYQKIYICQPHPLNAVISQWSCAPVIRSPEYSGYWSDHSDGRHTLYVAVHQWEGRFPFFHEAAGYTFAYILRIHTDEAFHRDEKVGEVAVLLKATL